jgi:hypothetical protein
MGREARLTSEPDLQAIIQEIQSGARLDYGGELERRKRRQLLDRIERLEEMLSQLTSAHGGIGHNKPPFEVEVGDPAEQIAAIGTVPATVKQELAKPEPDALEVARSALWLQRFGRWLAGKGDTSADEFAKAFGKSFGDWLGKAAVVTVAGGGLAGLVAAIYGVIHAATQWLVTVIWGL